MSNITSILLLSLISTIIFGLIDALLFLGGENELQTWLQKNRFVSLDENMAELITGGLSASLAVLVATLIRLQLHKKFQIFEHPLLDVIGIMTGTMIVVFIYYFWKKRKQNVNNF